MTVFGKVKIQNVQIMFENNKIKNSQCLEMLKSRIPMFEKAKIQNSNVWESQNPGFYCFPKSGKTKYRIPMFGTNKIQNFCNFTIAMTTFCMSQCQDGDEVLKCCEKTLENLNTQKSISRRILTGTLSPNFDNSELKPNLRSKHLTRYDPG